MKTTVLNEPKVEIAELMKEILADEFVLYTKARNYHWNVTGPLFYSLHSEFEKLYEGLADDIDEIAERIRALGSKAPGTMNEFLTLSTLQEEPGKYPDYLSMVQNIVNDLESIAEKANSAAVKMQNEFNDEVSAGIFYELAGKYQKIVWMLKSLLER